MDSANANASEALSPSLGAMAITSKAGTDTSSDPETVEESAQVAGHQTPLFLPSDEENVQGNKLEVKDAKGKGKELLSQVEQSMVIDNPSEPSPAEM